MLNDREKLIELILEADEVCSQTDCLECKYQYKRKENTCGDVMLADYLIANGVAVQRWIPVTERLPEDGQIVLTCKNGICEVQTYEARRNGWVSGRWFWSMAFVTHWMPLPNPPKDGE